MSERAVASIVLAGMLAVGLAAGLAACGSGGNGEASKPASQILKDAKSATESATSVRIDGRVAAVGQVLGLDVVATPTRLGGSVTLSAGTLDVVRANGDIYLKASASTWDKLAGSSSAGVILANRWWSAPATDKDFSQFSQLFTLTGLVGSLKPKGTLVKESTTTVNGESVIPLHDAGRDATLYVDATGKPYIYEVVSPKGTIHFSDYGTAPAPAIPAGARSLTNL